MARIHVDEVERRRADAAAQRAPAPVVPTSVASVQALQRSAGNAAAAELLRSAAIPCGPGDAFAHATSGAPSALPHRAQMDSAFGQSFAASRLTSGPRRRGAASPGLAPARRRMGPTSPSRTPVRTRATSRTSSPTWCSSAAAGARCRRRRPP